MESSPTDNLAVKAKVAAYLLMNQEIAAIKSKQDNIKKELEPYLQSADTNARGSHVIAFSEPLEVNGKQYGSLQKTKKVSKMLNEERALKFLKKDQAFECAIVTVEHVDQNVLWDLFVQDLISQEELDSFFDETVSYSFNPTKL